MLFFGYETLDNLLANTVDYSARFLCLLCVSKVRHPPCFLTELGHVSHHGTPAMRRRFVCSNRCSMLLFDGCITVRDDKIGGVK